MNPIFELGHRKKVSMKKKREKRQNGARHGRPFIHGAPLRGTGVLGMHACKGAVNSSGTGVGRQTKTWPQHTANEERAIDGPMQRGAADRRGSAGEGSCGSGDFGGG